MFSSIMLNVLFKNNVISIIIIVIILYFKILRCIRSVEDCKLLQSDSDAVHKCCLDNGINLNVGKATFISFTRESNSIALDIN